MKAICIGNKGNCIFFDTLEIGKTYKILANKIDGNITSYNVEGHERCRHGCMAWYWAENFIPVSNIDEMKLVNKRKKKA